MTGNRRRTEQELEIALDRELTLKDKLVLLDRTAERLTPAEVKAIQSVHHALTEIGTKQR